MNAALAFAAVVDSAPLLKSDAIVVLTGDGEARLDYALQLMKMGGAQTLLISGGLDNPPFALSAKKLARKAVEAGLAPDRLVLELESQHTRDQAVNVLAMATERDWHRLILVASPFHAWRAYLTFVAALQQAGADHTVHVINAPASHLKWNDVPVGLRVTRLALLGDEVEKIERYREAGHVASYEDGLAYLRYWEQNA